MLAAAIDELPVGYRTVFVLRDLEDLSTAEVAQSLRLSEQAVKMRLHRARAALRGSLYDRVGASALRPFAFDGAAANRGEQVFAANCARCHVPPAYTEPGWDLHTGAEIGIDDFQASRSPDGMYRTTPLRGLFARAKGGFYHDGRFATLGAVVDHYDSALTLGLPAAQKSDLVEFLKSL